MEHVLDTGVVQFGGLRMSYAEKCVSCRHNRQYTPSHLVSASDPVSWPATAAAADHSGQPSASCWQRSAPPSSSSSSLPRPRSPTPTLVFPVRVSRPTLRRDPRPHSSSLSSRDALATLPTAVAAVAFSYLDAADHLRFGRCSRSLRVAALLPASMAPVMAIRVAAPVSYWNKLRVVPTRHLTLCVKPPTDGNFGSGQLDPRHSAGAAVAALTLALGRVETGKVISFTTRAVPLISAPPPPSPSSSSSSSAPLSVLPDTDAATSPTPPTPAETKTVRMPVSVQRLLPRLTLDGFWRESTPSLVNLPARTVEIRPCAAYPWLPEYARRVWAQLAGAPHIEALVYPSLILPHDDGATLTGSPKLHTLLVHALQCLAPACEAPLRSVTDLSIAGPLIDDDTVTIVAALAFAPLARLALREPAREVSDALWNSVQLAATLHTLEFAQVPYMRTAVDGVQRLTALVHLRLGQDPGYSLGRQDIVRDWRGLDALGRLETLDLSGVCVPEPCRTCDGAEKVSPLLLPHLPGLVEFRAPADASFDSLWTDADPRTRLAVFPKLERLHWSALRPASRPPTRPLARPPSDEMEFSVTDANGAGDEGDDEGDNRPRVRLRLLALAKLPPHARLRELHAGTHAMRVDHVCAFAGRWRARFPALERVVGAHHRLELATLDADYWLGGDSRSGHISLGEAPPPPPSSSSSSQ